MFEQYIENSVQNILNNIDTEKQYVYLNEILSNPSIEQTYKNYFKAEVGWWLYEEQVQRLNNPFFDLNNEDLKLVFDELDELYIRNARFDQDNLKKVGIQAVRTRVNLLCRPRTAIKWFVFRGEPTKTYKEILLRLDFISDYPYLVGGFYKWIEQKKEILKDNSIISLPEFEHIIETIDNEEIFDVSPSQFVEILSSIFNFFNLNENVNDDAEMPIEALIIFLDDKGIFKISEKFQKCYEEDSIEMINKNKILELIYEVIEEVESESNNASSIESDEYVIQEKLSEVNVIEDTLNLDELKNEYLTKIDIIGDGTETIVGIDQIKNENNDENNFVLTIEDHSNIPLEQFDLSETQQIFAVNNNELVDERNEIIFHESVPEQNNYEIQDLQIQDANINQSEEIISEDSYNENSVIDDDFKDLDNKIANIKAQFDSQKENKSKLSESDLENKFQDNIDLIFEYSNNVLKFGESDNFEINNDDLSCFYEVPNINDLEK